MLRTVSQSLIFYLYFFIVKFSFFLFIDSPWAYTNIFNMTKAFSLSHYFFILPPYHRRHYIHTKKTRTGINLFVTLFVAKIWSSFYPCWRETMEIKIQEA
jgi:hypothetical protein